MTDSSSKNYQPIPTLRTGRAHPHPDPIAPEPYSAVELMPGYRVVVLDQRRLPSLERYEFFTSVSDVAASIRDMLVRGAPAIGVCGAYGMVVAGAAERGDEASFRAAMQAADALLRASRPTAVNLAWALDKMLAEVEAIAALEPSARTSHLAKCARAIHQAEVASCRALGAFGGELVPDGATILTHCNAGALATGGYGSALGIVRAAREAGKKLKVLACETRPYLQGARLTAWELSKDGIDVEVITDGMVAHFMSKGVVDLVIVGADRIAANGDAANKIGTYGHACVAAAHKVPFYVAAPWSTVDLACPDGGKIPIEERSEREITHLAGPDGAVVQLVPDGVHARNPSFDVTPASLIAAIVTERGVVAPVGPEGLARLAG